MSRPFVFTLEARDEMDDAFAWYEQQREGLGEEFLEALYGVLERIEKNPELYRQVYRDIRRGVTHRFPYSICYRIRTDHIEILAVYHGFRDPRGWFQRS